MTRKDYELIADALNAMRFHNLRDDAPEGAAYWHRVACDEMALRLAHDNPRFDRKRFLKACGVQS